MQQDSVNISVIGAGRAGKLHARNYAYAVLDAELRAVADADADAAREAAAEARIERYYTDYRELLKDDELDAVVIVTPTVLHREVAVAAAEAGKHIFCEKPMAMTTEECDDMNRAAARAGVHLQIGFMRRFDRNFVGAKEAIDRGEIGDVVMVRSLTHGPSTPKPWMYDIRKSNGPLAEINSHDIDTLRWLTGGEAEEVYALAGNFRNPQVREEYPEFYDNLVMTVRMSDNLQGVVEGAAAVRYGYDSRVEVLGTNGVLFVGQLPESNVTVVKESQGIVQRTVPSWRNLFRDAYLAEDRAFVESVRHGTPPAVTGVDGRAAVEMVVAGNRSILERRPVQVSERRS